MGLSKTGPGGVISGGGRLDTWPEGEAGNVGGGDPDGLMSEASNFSLASKLERTGVDAGTPPELAASSAACVGPGAAPVLGPAASHCARGSGRSASQDCSVASSPPRPSAGVAAWEQGLLA